MNTTHDDNPTGSVTETAITPRRSPLVQGTYKLKATPSKPKGSPSTQQRQYFSNPVNRSIKESIAILTVSASIIGACTTIASFANSINSTAEPRVAVGTDFSSATLNSNNNNSASVPTKQNPQLDNDPNFVKIGLAARDGSGKSLGLCTLASTTVDAKLSGYVARVNVTQVYSNPYKEKIEAIYNFPLSDESAVDDMTIKIGDRTVKGEIKLKEEAHKIYQQAKDAGHVAALLDQQRTNIFTQHVANIEPGKEIVVQISYVELLHFESGRYTFAVPTTIGPRFFPSKSEKNLENSASNKLAQMLPGNVLAENIVGQNLSINVDVDAGMPIKNISSKTFPILVSNQSSSHSLIGLRNSVNQPNKDFVLTYDMDNADAIKSGYLACRDPRSKDKDGYATFMLLPPAKVTGETASPKEMIFLLDCSGSQSGKPIEKAKETMHYIVDHMNANDTFQVLAFNDTVSTLSDEPVHANPIERIKAHTYINGLQANGGTWMGPAVEKVLHQKVKEVDDLKRLRIVTFMTDGLVGNDVEICNLVKKERGQSRWFPFGTGDGVNRLLIDNVARLGGGEPDYVLLDSSAEEVGKKFYDCISSPSLTDVHLKAEGIDLYDVYPGEVSDVWANKPLYFTARYKNGGSGTVTLTGLAHGRPYSQTLSVTLPVDDNRNASIEKVWARQKITHLIDQDLAGLSAGTVQPSIKKAVEQVALEHKLMSDFTSFVAVDSATTAPGNLMQVPVPNVQPEGVDPTATGQYIGSYSGIQGATNGTIALQGATNGMIGPQGADATLITGVNTAGTVRVNNLANIEGTLNIVSNLIEILGLIWGVPTIIYGFTKLSSNRKGAMWSIVYGSIALVTGLATPAAINWIMSSLRDGGGFN